MADVFKYRVWCETEGKYVEGWFEEEPTTCPNNNTHTIDTSKTSIVEDISTDEKRDPSGKLRVHETSRALGTITYFTGQGDDPSDVSSVGGGDVFIVDHAVGDGPIHEIYLEFNCVENQTWIHEGYITWDNCDFDLISFGMVPRVVTYTTGTNTNYNLYNNYLVVPAAGDGTIEITSDLTDPNGGLVFIPKTDLGEQPTAFWNADYNPSTKLYENITPAPAGDGQYNMFAVEVWLAKVVNKLPLVGNGFQRMQSADSDQLGHGMRFKAIVETNTNNDRAYKVACILTMHRQRTS